MRVTVNRFIGAPIIWCKNEWRMKEWPRQPLREVTPESKTLSTSLEQRSTLTVGPHHAGPSRQWFGSYTVRKHDPAGSEKYRSWLRAAPGGCDAARVLGSAAKPFWAPAEAGTSSSAGCGFAASDYGSEGWHGRVPTGTCIPPTGEQTLIPRSFQRFTWVHTITRVYREIQRLVTDSCRAWIE